MYLKVGTVEYSAMALLIKSMMLVFGYIKGLVNIIKTVNF